MFVATSIIVSIIALAKTTLVLLGGLASTWSEWPRLFTLTRDFLGLSKYISISNVTNNENISSSIIGNFPRISINSTFVFVTT
tara:strand:- start:144 stop:392 length:249 start_codon:yes stop_codon:yes gene_type:complete